jgi:hypothetical protein
VVLMAFLEGSVKTPFGEVSKKTAVLVGGGAGLLLVILYYRSRKNAAAAAATAAAGANTGIDPATGYTYGSPEDAAALAAQGAYVTPGGSGGGGGGSATTITGFVSNGQWAQAAEQFMQAEGLIADPAALASALGKYITGQPASDIDMNLINQAIAFQGLPPVAGPSGYPPSINRAPVPPPTDTPPSGGGGSDKLPPPSGFHDTGRIWDYSLQYQWTPVAGAQSYVLRTNEGDRNVGNVNAYQRFGLIHNGTYFTQIASVNAAGVVGDFSSTLESHTKN